MLRTKYKWIYKSNDDFTYNPDINISKEIQYILCNRGIKTKEQIKNFLNPTKEKFYDPYLLNDMNQAVERIDTAKINGEKVVIYGDYDVDGVTSTSILYRYLKSIGIDVFYYIPNRVDEGYGINLEAIDILKDKDMNLLITVDTGIVAHDEVNYANKIGMDVIITDHHEVQGEIPNALAVINPKRLDSTYPFNQLAGVGVAFKLIHALAIKYDQVDKIWQYLDLVSVGTVSDIVPLVDENRVIVKNGFDVIKNSNNVGLKELLNSVDFNKDINSGFIGFVIAPRINAAGRIDDANKCVKLFITEDKIEAMNIVSELHKNNEERQKIEKDILDEVDEYIINNVDLDKEKIIIAVSSNWHHGVIGIVASKIVDRYYRPVILLDLKDGVMSGSSRSVQGFSIFDAIYSAKDELIKFGGHEMAAGLSLDESNFNNFKSKILKYADENLSEEIMKRKIFIDEKINEDKLNINFLDELERLEPYGMGNPEPVFEIDGMVRDYKQIGKLKNHFKLQIKKNKEVLNAIMFNDEYLNDNLCSDLKIDIIGNIKKNEWNNIVKPQMIMKDIQINKEVENYIINESKIYDDIKLNGKNSKYIEELDLTKKEVSRIYKCLINEGKFKNNISYVKLIFILDRYHNIRFSKLLLAIDIFEELNIAKFEICDNNFYFELFRDKKVDLTQSKLYNIVTFK